MRTATRHPQSLVWLAVAAIVASACAQEPSTTIEPTTVPDPEPLGQELSSAPAPAAPARAAAEGFARDVVLITLDTLRYDALGFAGRDNVETPNLDRLASEGLHFERAHAHSVMTLPSHASLLTGLLPFEHGVRDNVGFVLHDGVQHVAPRFKAGGFATAAVIAAFPLDARYGLARGFDLYDDSYDEGSAASGLPERRGSEVVGAALDWWKANAGTKRFLWLHLYDPHAPYAPEEPWASVYRESPYHGEVAAVDSYLGPLLEQLRSEEAPLVVVTSDHGEGLGDHGEATHGLFAYETTLHVPLIVWAPGQIDAARSAFPAQHIDVAPTLLAGAGLEPFETTSGISLLARAPQGTDPQRVTYFEALGPALNRGWAPLRGVVQDDLKFIALPIPELYDLRRDPAELDNLARDRANDSRRLFRQLPELSQWPPPQRTAPSAEERRALASLGYLAGSSSKTTFTEDDDPKKLVKLDAAVHEFGELRAQGRLQEAEAAIRGVVAQRPDMAVALYYHAQVLLDLGRVQDAVGVMRQAVASDVASSSLRRQLALTLAEMRRPDEAISVLDPLVQGSTPDPDALNALGTVLAEAGRFRSARERLQQVFQVDPRNPEAHQNLALVSVLEGDWSRAENAAREALRLNDGLHLAWNYLGMALYNKGRIPDALEAWQRSVEAMPDDYDVLYNLGVVAAQQGRRDLAAPALRRFIDRAPQDRYRDDIFRARELLRQLGL